MKELLLTRSICSVDNGLLAFGALLQLVCTCNTCSRLYPSICFVASVMSYWHCLASSVPNHLGDWVAGRNNQIRVSELSRPRLLDSLGLNQVQLQQLAGLLGNDHIKHIARDKIQQLKEQHPNEHVCSVLARQVLELQPALGFPAVPIPPAPQADAEVIDPAVKQAVSAAIAAIGGKTAEDTAQECLPLEEQPAAVTGNTAERKIGEDAAQVEAPAEDSAADHAAGDADEGDDVEEDHSNEDAEFKGEEEHAGGLLLSSKMCFSREGCSSTIVYHEQTHPGRCCENISICVTAQQTGVVHQSL